jgi:integrase
MGVKVRCIKGRWKVMVDFRQHRKSKTFSSEEKARDFAQRLKTALDLYGFGALDLLKCQQPAERKAPTVEEYSNRWLEEIEKTDRARNTCTNYRVMLQKHIVPSLGSCRLDQIEYPALKNFAIEKSGTYSRNSVRLMFAALRAMCSEAVRERILQSNPVKSADLAQFIGRRSQGRRRAQPDPFSLEELHALEARAREKHPEYYPFILALARTGMRISEAIALTWTDVDFRGRYIVVRHSLPQHRELGEPKTPAGHRKIEMSEELANELLKLRTEKKKACLAKGETEIPKWVFSTRTGTPLHYRNFLDRVWNRLQDAAGVRRRTPHDLRHAFATLHLEGGASPVWVKEQLGHSSIQVTVDFYKHWIPRTNRDGINRLDTQQTRIFNEEADEIGN